MSERDLGDMGEDTFKLWCSSAGMTANGSRLDKNGWDFYVEFPFPEDASVDLDLDEKAPPIECKVQVKATDSEKSSIQIKLSNLHKLIKYQGPAFLCVICFDGQISAQRAYFVHIDKCVIERVLKRLRELSNAGDTEEHKKSLSLEYADHCLTGLTGACVKNKILSIIGQSPVEYVKTKQQLVETLGYENGRNIAHFTVSGKNSVADLVDLSLGLKDEVKVSNFSAHKVRFGLKSPAPIFNGSGIIKIHPDPVCDATVSFRSDQFTPPISFAAKFYSSQFNSFVGAQGSKVRLLGDFFDIVISFSGKVNVSFSFSAEKAYPLRDSYKFFQLLQLFHRTASDTTLYLNVSMKTAGEISLPLNPDDSAIVGDERMLLLCKKALDISNKFGAEDVMVSGEQLNQFSEGIERLYVMTCEKIRPNAAQCSFSTEEKLILGDSRECACIFPVSALIGSYVFSAIVVGVGKLLEQSSTDENQVIFDSFETAGEFFCKQDDTAYLNEKIESEILKQADLLKKQDIAAVVMQGSTNESTERLRKDRCLADKSVGE